ncbi:DUF3833 domain-containing protein [Fluctibacter halophilus]|nr:DUF3833 domain-containing protein [Aestuariibacter halophilus]
MRWMIIALSFLLNGCSTQLSDYPPQGQPSFDLQRYFNGNLTAWGIVEDYAGKLTRRFCVDIRGEWEGNRGTLHETFYYADGEEQVRIWHLNVDDQGVVTGSAADVIGTASGQAQGHVFNWQYTLSVPIDGENWEFAIDDWMYQMDDNRLMNRSYMKKWGITVASISIFFDKTQPLRECRSS